MKKAIFLTLSLIALSLGLWLSFRSAIIHKANQHAEEILSGTNVSSSYAIALHATEKIYKSFHKDGYENHRILARLRPYITNERLPYFIRIPKGSLALTTMGGWCDDAARALIYTLGRRNIKAQQWNMQGPANAHAAVIVDFGNGHTALLDPFYGYHSITSEGAVSPLEAGKRNALIPLDENSNRDFYSRYDKRFMGIQGEPLAISVHIPETDVPLVLGEANGNYEDARRGLGKYGMTIAWEYIGHKYDRGWTRELIAQQDLQLQIILIEEPDAGVLRTLSPTPAIDGAKLSWNLLKDQKIISQDGLAGISLSRLNSYIDIDQIIITPANETRGETP